MPREARVITRADLMPVEQYAKERAERRRALLPVKKLRRIDVGPQATFYFENFDTMWLQVQEMLYIEKGGEAQIADELTAYNPLIPQQGELVATLMFEIDDPVRREKVLGELGHVEETVYFEVGGERVRASFETDVERTTEAGKTSSVHFLRFRLTPQQIVKFRDDAAAAILGLSHPNYAHMTALQPATRAELAKDLG